MSLDTEDNVSITVTDVETVEAIATAIGERFDQIEAKIDKILTISERVETIANAVASQVKPVLDDLMKSPLLKMLGVKSK